MGSRPRYGCANAGSRSENSVPSEAELFTVSDPPCTSTTHLVIETYTWPLLVREEDLVKGITREFRWLLNAIH